MASLSSSFARFAKRSAGVVTFLLGISVLPGVISPDGERSAPQPEPEKTPLKVTLGTDMAGSPASNLWVQLQEFQNASRETFLDSVYPRAVESVLPTATSTLTALGDLMGRETLSRTDIRTLQEGLKKVADPKLTPSGTLTSPTLKALQKAVVENPALAAHLGEAVLQAFAKQGKLDTLGKVLADTPAARDTFAQTALPELKKKKAESRVSILPFQLKTRLVQGALRDFRPGPVDGRYGDETAAGAARYEAKLAEAMAHAAPPPTAPIQPNVSTAAPSPPVATYPALSQQTFDKAAIKALQSVVGVKASGVLTSGTAKALRGFLKDHPEAHASLGKAALQFLKDSGEQPKAVGDLVRFIQKNPDQARTIGEGLVTAKGDAYLYRLAVRVATGMGAIKDMHNSLTSGELAAIEASLVKKAADARKLSGKGEIGKANVTRASAQVMDLSKFQPFLTAPTLDRNATKNLQTLLGIKKPSGVVDAATGERVRSLLSKNPDAIPTLGKGLTEALQKTKTLPGLAGDLARLFRNDPDKIRTLGHAAIRSGTPPYLLQLALTAAAGGTDVRDTHAPLTEARLTQAFGDVLFLTKGITSTTPAKDAKGQYIPDPIGLSLLAFSPTNKASVKACQDALATLGFDAGTPKEGAGKKFGTALANLLSKDDALRDRLVKSGGPGVAVFGYLLSDKKRAAEAGRILGSSPSFQTGLIKDLIQYGAELDSALSAKAGPKAKKTASLDSPDNKTALALRLGLVSQERDYRPDPKGNAFSKSFALAAAAYLRAPAGGPAGGGELSAVKSLKLQAASVYTAASRLKMTVIKPTTPAASRASLGSAVQGRLNHEAPSVEILKKRYPHDKNGIVETVVDVAAEHGLNPATLLAIVDMESTLNPTARPLKPNGKRASSAYGLAQALDDTWMKWWKKFGADLEVQNKPQTQQEILDLRADPRVAVTLMARAIKASGTKNPLDAYWDIHFGGGGASALRNASPETSVAAALNCGKTMGANAYLNELTVGELAARHTGALAKRGGMGSLYADAEPSPRKIYGLGRVTFRVPLEGRSLPGGFGMRDDPVDGEWKLHKGLDFPAPAGTAIYAAADGVIKEVAYDGWNGGFGRYVLVEHDGGRFSTIYAHMSQPAEGLSVGMRVDAGQKIGAVGTTGKSTGNHLHYGLEVNGTYVDPRNYAHITFNMEKGVSVATQVEKASTPYTRPAALARTEITLPRARQSFGLGDLTADKLALAFSPPPVPTVQPAVVGPVSSPPTHSWALAALMSNLRQLSPVSTAHAEMVPTDTMISATTDPTSANGKTPTLIITPSPTQAFRTEPARTSPTGVGGSKLAAPPAAPLGSAVVTSGYGSPRVAFNPCAIIRQLPGNGGFKRTAISLVCGGPT